MLDQGFVNFGLCVCVARRVSLQRRKLPLCTIAPAKTMAVMMQMVALWVISPTNNAANPIQVK